MSKYNSKDQISWKRGQVTHTKLWTTSFNKISGNKSRICFGYLLLMTYICYRKINTHIKHKLFTLQFFVESRRFVLSNWGSEAKRRPVSPLKARLWDILTDFSDWNWKVVWEESSLLGSLLSSQRLLSRTCLFFSNGRSTFTSNLYATKGRESEIVFLVILKNRLCSYTTCYQSNIRRQSKGIINYCRFLKGS